MAVEVAKGNIYTASMVRSGISQRGDWEMVKVKDKTKEITIWPDNRPTGLTDGDEFSVEEITSVRFGARKRQDGNWRDDCSITAILKPAKARGYDFGVDNIDDGELPWKMDDSPFGIPAEDQLPL